MKTIRFISIILGSAITLFSCSRFEDMNQSPDKTNKVPSSWIATSVMKGAFRFQGNQVPKEFYQAANQTNKLICRFAATENVVQYFYSYSPYGSFDAYLNLTDLAMMSKYAEGSPQADSFKGLEHFMKAWYGLRMTLAMGDIPYREAGKAAEGISRPVYDKQADVFAQIIEDFGKAAECFSRGARFDGDIMYGGDPAKWEKLSNVMRLKTIQTISRKATSEQKALFADIVSSARLMESKDDDFKLVYSTNPNATFPFFDGAVDRTGVGISELCAETLKTLKDRRLFYFADPAPALLADGELTESDFDAYVGGPTQLAPEILAVNAAAGKYSFVNDRYTKFRDGDPLLMVTYSEQCFIIAEAIEEGWIGGDARSWYENGVKAQLQHYRDLNAQNDSYLHGMKIDDVYIASYFTGEAAYKVSGSKTDRLRQVWSQRWLIDYFSGRDEYYWQFIRTGWPQYPLDPATCMNPEDKTTWPKRWMYPASEKTTNPDNYQKAIDEQFGGYDSVNKLPWWQQ